VDIDVVSSRNFLVHNPMSLESKNPVSFLDVAFVKHLYEQITFSRCMYFVNINMSVYTYMYKHIYSMKNKLLFKISVLRILAIIISSATFTISEKALKPCKHFTQLCNFRDIHMET
jgi:hypothetical protein